MASNAASREASRGVRRAAPAASREGSTTVRWCARDEPIGLDADTGGPPRLASLGIVLGGAWACAWAPLIRDGGGAGLLMI